MKTNASSFTPLLLAVVLSLAAACDSDDAWEFVELPTSAELRCLVLDDDGRLLVGTLGDGLWRDEADGWNRVPGSEDLNIHRLLTREGILYAATDAGLWALEPDGRLNHAALDEPLWSLAADSDGLLIGGVGTVHRFSTAGALAALPAGLPDYAVTAVAAVGDVIYAGTLGDGLWRLEGESWQGVADSRQKPLEAERITLLDYDPAAEALYLGSMYHGLYRSADGGGSFTKERGRGPEYNYITALVRGEGRLLISTAGIRANGVFSSPEELLNWQPVAGSPTTLRDLTADDTGRLWAVADDGLYRGPTIDAAIPGEEQP